MFGRYSEGIFRKFSENPKLGEIPLTKILEIPAFWESFLKFLKFPLLLGANHTRASRTRARVVCRRVGPPGFLPKCTENSSKYGLGPPLTHPRGQHRITFKTWTLASGLTGARPQQHKYK